MYGLPQGVQLVNRRTFLIQTGLATACLAFARPLMASDDCKRLQALTNVWAKVRPVLATRYHRLHHCLFHLVRNTWPRFDDSQRNALRDLGWNVPRPAFQNGSWQSGRAGQGVFWATTNGSGEDFLFYHRWMIAMVNAHLKEHGAGPVESWSGIDELPPPGGGCEDEAVPQFLPAYVNPSGARNPIKPKALRIRVRETKSDEFFWNRMIWWAREFRDPGALRRMSLGELGSRLEMAIHNQMHIRWAAYPSNGKKAIRDESDFRKQWDDPKYDTLIDEYSAHVSPIFFRIHQWIDNRIEDWAEAQGSSVKRLNTPHGFSWFEKGDGVAVDQPWTGAYSFDTPTAGEEQERIRAMEKVTAVLFPSSQKPKGMKTFELEKEAEERKVISLRDLAL